MPSTNDSDAVCRLAVVYVHGLFSDSAAWDQMDRLVESDSKLSAVARYRFKYDSSMKSRGVMRETPTLDSVSDSLHTFLRHAVVESEVVLVCHSQGGLVALRFLARRLQDAVTWDGPEIRLVLLYACPQQGSTFGSRVRRFLFDDHAQAKSLKPFDQPTADSIRAVLTHTSSLTGTLSDLVVTAVAGASDGIVTPTSARGYWEIAETVPGDHSTIIRPSTRQDQNYLVLQKRVLGVMRAPVVSLSPEDVDTTRMQWLEIAMEVSARLNLAHWDFAIGGLARTSYALPSSVHGRLHDFGAWLLSRNLPAGQPELRLALDVVQSVVVDLLTTFNKYTEVVHAGADDPWIRVHKWYSAGGFNPNYDRDVRAYSTHVNLLFNLTLELTRAVQWFCDVVRRDLDPTFRFSEGALVVEAGPFADGDTWILRPSYEAEGVPLDRAPYTTVEAFQHAERFRPDSLEETAPSQDDAATRGGAFPITNAEKLERQLVDRQLNKLDAELEIYRSWRASASRDSLERMLRLAESTNLIGPDGFRVPIWETSAHLRFCMNQGQILLQIETDNAEILSRHEWIDGRDTRDIFDELDRAMNQIGEHLGPGLFLPTKCVSDAADALLFASRYRSQSLNQGSELFEHLTDFVDGWYISKRGLFPQDHPFYLIARERIDEMDWADQVSGKGWAGIHRAIEVARALYDADTEPSDGGGV